MRSAIIRFNLGLNDKEIEEFVDRLKFENKDYIT